MHTYTAVTHLDVSTRIKQTWVKYDYTRKNYFEVHHTEHLISLDNAMHWIHFHAFDTLTKIQFYENI